MSKHGTLFGFILGAGAVAGLVALSKKTEAVEQLKAKYKAVVEEMKDYADMSGKHDGACTGNCDKCKVSEAMDKMSNIKHAVEKKVFDVVSGKEQFDTLVAQLVTGVNAVCEQMGAEPFADGDALFAALEAEAGRIRVLHSDCPSQDCVHTGWVSRSGGQIICLPNRLVVTVTGGAAEADAVTG